MLYNIDDIIEAYKKGFAEGSGQQTIADTAEFDEVAAEPTEEDKYWQTVNQNIANYNGTGEGQKDVE